MPTFVVPYRLNGKSRLGDPEIARAMLEDVCAACAQLGEVLVCDAPGGQGQALAAFLEDVFGPVVIVNADVPCAGTDELEALAAAAPALVSAQDGTTNALSLTDARDFVPLYGAGSASRYTSTLNAQALDLAGLRDDVDTWDDLVRVGERAGPSTRRLLKARAA